jgi:hypothetical protein
MQFAGDLGSLVLKLDRVKTNQNRRREYHKNPWRISSCYLRATKYSRFSLYGVPPTLCSLFGELLDNLCIYDEQSCVRCHTDQILGASAEELSIRHLCSFRCGRGIQNVFVHQRSIWGTACEPGVPRGLQINLGLCIHPLDPMAVWRGVIVVSTLPRVSIRLAEVSIRTTFSLYTRTSEYTYMVEANVLV